MPGAGRLGDSGQNNVDAHGCPGCPHSTLGPAIMGSRNVNVNTRPALRVNDMGIHAACCGPNTWTAMKGSATVFINGLAAHRINDAQRHCGGIGKLIVGSANVIIGDAGSSGRGGGGGSSESDSGGASAAGPGNHHGVNSSGSASGGASGGDSSSASAADSAAPSVTPEPDLEDAWLEVEVLDEEGKPVAGMAYKLELTDGTIVEGKLDDQGSVRKEDLKAGVGRFWLPDDDDAALPSYLAQSSKEKDDAWIEVEVRDEAGRPAAGMRYKLVLTDGTTVEGELDETGRIRKEKLPDGDCTLYLPDEEAIAAVLPALPPLPPKQPDLAFIEIMVRDESGQPAADLPFRLELPDGKVVEGKLDASGRFRKDGIPAGNCKLFLPDEEAAAVVVAVVPALPPPERAWIELEMQDEEGRPVAEAPFELTLPDGAKRSGKLDAGGRARFADLPPGSCSVKWIGRDADAVEIG